MNYLLDTCIVSELVKPAPYGKVTDWIDTTPSETLFLSVLTIGEIRKGLARLPDSKCHSHNSEVLVPRLRPALIPQLNAQQAKHG